MRTETAGFTRTAADALLAYSWPGNLRELSNRIRRAVLLAERPLLACQDLGLDMAAAGAYSRLKGMPAARVDERERIGRVLDENCGNVSRAAESLGISRVTLYKKMRKYGLE